MLRGVRTVFSSSPAAVGLRAGWIGALSSFKNLADKTAVRSLSSVLAGTPTTTTTHSNHSMSLLGSMKEKREEEQTRQQQQRRCNRTWARRQALRKRFTEEANRQAKPTLDKAMTMPTSYSEMDNAELVVLGRMGIHGANKEILKRHIMTVDHVSYEKAEQTYQTISDANKEYMFVLSLPYQIGIATAVTMGVLSLPMVFHYGTAEWFNHNFVTTDVPEPKDLETYLEVGAWTWNWMEPVLGTLSFFLLTFQFSRSQLDNLGIKPYTHKVKQWRAERLAEKFPQYDVNVIIAYSKSATIHSSSKQNYSY